MLQDHNLHSHSIAYGSGSGQNSVTAHGAKDDQQSLWTIKEGHGDAVCEVGTPVRCGDTVQLQHVATGKNLHSHHFKSPISNNQEVSGFGDDGRGTASLFFLFLTAMNRLKSICDDSLLFIVC
jgi:dolichyl-phosphate-mannose--protein O-mannosyl transferase